MDEYLTSGLNYAVADAEGTEEKLVDDMPDKAELLYYYGGCFLTNFLRNDNQKEDIDKCILAYESAINLTPQGHSDMSQRLNMLGVSLLYRFNLTGDLTDI